MKLYIRFVLTLCLLFSGYGNLYTYARKAYIFHSPVKLLASSDGGYVFEKHTEFHFRNSLPEANAEIDALEVNYSEDEDDEYRFAPVKKLPVSLNYFSTFFNSQSYWHFFPTANKSFALSQHLSVSICRYLMLCIFRI